PNGLNIIPGTFSIIGYGGSGCLSPSVNDIFNLSVCDLSVFNGMASSLAMFVYFVSYAIGVTPSISVSFYTPDTDNLDLSFSDISLTPGEVESILGTIYSALVFVILLSKLQLIILSGSLLFLSVFLTLGLVMRTLGVTRSFGGAMIAFGLGLGLIYPLLTAITYGFIDTSVNAICLGSVACTTAGMANAVITLLFSMIFPLTVPSLAAGAKFFGYLVAGLTFIPFINFTIVDAFIIDFSKAIGEKMDFMSLLSGLI
ncbi:MAG: hypothetical protein ACP5FR_01520, partial [Candidatus Micrarchaeia archaeon]